LEINCCTQANSYFKSSYNIDQTFAICTDLCSAVFNAVESAYLVRTSDRQIAINDSVRETADNFNAPFCSSAMKQLIAHTNQTKTVQD